MNPDHFTDTGVEDVYSAAPAKAGAPRLKQKLPASNASTHQTNSTATLQPVAKRTPVSATQPGPKAITDKRKPVPAAPKKQ